MKAAVVAAVDRARIADRRAAPRRGRARSDPPVALRRQRRAACGARRARRSGARGQPARGAHPLCRRRPAAVAQQRGRARDPARHLAGPPGRGARRARQRRRADRRGRGSGRRLRRAGRAAAATVDAALAALREAQATSNEQREVVAGVQQQIQVLAAEMRSVDEQARRPRAGASAWSAEETGPGAGRPARSSTPPGSAPPRSKPSTTPPKRACTSWQERVPALDEARRAQQDAANDEARRQADLARPPGGAAGAAGEGADRGQAEALARPARPRSLHGLWTRVHIEPGWETGARGGAARAPRLARGRPARHGARLRRRCAAGPAGVLHPAHGADRQHAPHAAAPDRPAAPRRLRA